MDAPAQAANSCSAAGSKSFMDAHAIADNDQLFLLYFIVGNYFGPHFKGEGLQKSLFQRAAEGLLTYTADQLARSYMETEEMEQIYYYVLRKADKCLALDLPLLQQFFLGNFPDSGTASYPQLHDMFPSHLHPYALTDNGFKIISNVIFINNPDTSHISSKDIERFKGLTKLQKLLLDRDAAKCYSYVHDIALYDVVVQQEWSSRSRANCSDSNPESSDIIVLDVTPLRSIPHRDLPPTNNRTTPLPVRDKRSPLEEGPGMFLLPSCPKDEEWTSLMAAYKSGIVLTGVAAMGQVGRTVGLVDIGESEDEYFFRVSVPGVRTDANEFSYTIEPHDKVLVKGVTVTGEKIVYRFGEKFVMQSQNLCPPGQFSISFQLPGPVDPHQLKDRFGIDGILEVIIKKSR